MKGEPRSERQADYLLKYSHMITLNDDNLAGTHGSGVKSLPFPSGIRACAENYAAGSRRDKTAV